MAIYLNLDCSVVLNGVDLSDHAFAATIHSEKEQVDVSGFNATGTKSYLPGERDETITISFLQDFAAAKVDATLWPLYNASTAFTAVLKPTSAAVSTTNPSYTATVSMFDYDPIAGDVGKRSETVVTLKVTSGTLVRATA